MKKFTLLLALLLSFSASAMSAERGPASEPLRWAADTEAGTPYVFPDPKDPSRIMGFEKEIIEAVAKHLERPAVFVQNAWDGLVPGLSRGGYDVIINGIEITPDREREIGFSRPYFITYESLTVRRDETRIQKLSDTKGKKVGTLKLSLAQRILEKEGGIEVVPYEQETNAYEDLKNGRIDAVLLDAPIAQYYAMPNPDFKAVGGEIGRVEYGIGMKKSDRALKAEIDQALSAMIASGDLRRIYDRYNLWNGLMAKEFKDSRAALESPSQYEYFLNATNRDRTFGQRLELYASFLPLLAKGALVTLGISLAAMLLAVAMGLVLALIRLYAAPVFSTGAMLYIELIRGTPLLIQLFFIFYALPHVGIKLSPFWAAVIGLGLNYAAYEAENYRAGILGVSRAQTEAGLALGMNRRQTIQHVVVPQAMRIVIPPITNDFISLLKDSSLVSVITMVELTKIYGQLAATYYDYIGTGILVAAFYLLLGLPFVRLARVVEERMGANVPPTRTTSTSRWLSRLNLLGPSRTEPYGRADGAFASAPASASKSPHDGPKAPQDPAAPKA